MSTQPTDIRTDDPMPMLDARSLLGADGRAGLMLDGTLYILRLTQSGKLILTK